MANNTEGKLIDLWNREEESTGLKGWLEENISKKGVEKFASGFGERLEKGLTEGGKNIFGQDVGPLTDEDLYGMVTGSVAGWSNNPTQYRRVLEAIPKRLKESYGAFREAMKDPGKLIKSINKRLTNKKQGPEGRYSEKFIKEVLDDVDINYRKNIKVAPGKPKPTPGPQMGGQQIPPGGRRGAGHNPIVPSDIETLF